MSPVPDRRQQRREYLKKKASGFVMSGMSVALPVIAVVATVMSAVYEDEHVIGLNTVVCIVACAPILGLFALKMSGHAEIASRAPFVPPVKASILPAEEILMRGAEEPAAPNETLLRAAGKGEETAKEQLLHVTPSATEEQAQHR